MTTLHPVTRSMNMREKMARALCILAAHDPDAQTYLDASDGRIVGPAWRLYLLQVDTALDVLMEPTTPILLAICDEAKKEQCRPIDVHRTDAALFFQSGIRAIKEGK